MLADVDGAYVVQGRVQAAKGSRGGTEGKNAFDESLISLCNGYLATVTGSGKITGTSGNDVIVGSSGDDIINGADGNDVLYGDQGNDLLKGEKSDDDLFGGEGADDLRGQQGADFFDGGVDDDTDTSDYNSSEDRGQVNVP